MAAPPPTRRTTRQVSRRLKDLTNDERQGKNKTKKSFTRRKTIGGDAPPPSSSLNVSAPDSRPSRMTASIVVQASSASREEEEKEEEKHKKQRDEEEQEEQEEQEEEGKKKQQKTRKRTRREEREDVLDLMCDEEPILLQRRRRSGDTAGDKPKDDDDDDDDEEGASKDAKVKDSAPHATTAARGATSTLAEYAYWAFSNDGGRRRTEERYTLDPYVKHGELFNPAMRQQVVNWMYKRSLRLSMAPETFHLAVRYCDTFLSKRECEVFLQKNGSGSEPVPAKSIEEFYVVEQDKKRRILFYAKEAEGTSAIDGVDFGGVTPIFPLGDDTVNQLCNKLKRLGATCLFVASKIVEVNPPSAVAVASCTEVSTFNRSQLLLAERALLRELDFFLYRPNPRAFLDAYIDVAHRTVAKISLEHPKKKEEGLNHAESSGRRKKVSGTSLLRNNLEHHKNKVEEFCELMIDLAVLSQQHLRWQPSVLAASALAIALEDEWYLSWDCEDMECMVELTGYTYDDLAECSRWLLAVLRSASIAEKIQGAGLSGRRWYSKLHANEKYRDVIDRVTDEKRPHMHRLESAFGYTNFTSKRGILLSDFSKIENKVLMADFKERSGVEYGMCGLASESED